MSPPNAGDVIGAHVSALLSPGRCRRCPRGLGVGNPKELLEALFAHYADLDEHIRAELPLQAHLPGRGSGRRRMDGRRIDGGRCLPALERHGSTLYRASRARQLATTVRVGGLPLRSSRRERRSGLPQCRARGSPKRMLGGPTEALCPGVVRVQSNQAFPHIRASSRAAEWLGSGAWTGRGTHPPAGACRRSGASCPACGPCSCGCVQSRARGATKVLPPSVALSQGRSAGVRLTGQASPPWPGGLRPQSVIATSPKWCC
jgi:hypothetical protein